MKTPGPGAGAPLVTIAIPTYNRAASYLPLALQSALDQTYPDIEVLVSDNASSDGTAALVSGVRDPRLRYLRHAVNIGANGNFNFCLEQAAGDYFLLLHDDDRIDPDFVAACLSAARFSRGFGLMRTGIRVIDGQSRIVRESANRAGGLALADYFLAWFDGRTAWYLANTLFHTGRLRAVGGFRSPRGLIEDGFAIARLAAIAPRLDIAEVKASFRVHGGEQTFAGAADHAVRWGEDYLALADCMSRLVPRERAAEVRRAALRFFARLTYNRAAAIGAPAARLRAYLEIFRLFHYRHLPVHHLAGRRLWMRAVDSARRRVRRALAPRPRPSALSR